MTTHSEENCPGHVASESDAKICRHCGTHIDSLRPPDDEPYYEKPYSEWTTEQLNAAEERMYDDECDGADTWFERDQILIELNRRDFK